MQTALGAWSRAQKRRLGLNHRAFEDLVWLSGVDGQVHRLLANESAMGMAVRVEPIVTGPAQLLTRLVTVAAREDIDVLVRTSDGDELDQLSRWGAELDQVGDATSVASAVTQDLQLHMQK